MRSFVRLMSVCAHTCVCVCVCVCVWERKSQLQRRVCVCVCVCVCACMCERERQGPTTAACVQTHTCFITVSVTWLFPSRAWTDGKTKDIINCLYFSFEGWSSRLWKGELHFQRVLEVFDQSQCSVSVGQSEQTVLVGRRDFVEN